VAQQQVRPILIAYDGSEASRAAVRAAGELFGGAGALVLTVWEPALAQVMLMGDATGIGATMLPYDPTMAWDAERASEARAQDVAQEGARLAEQCGLRSQALTAEETVAPQDAIVAAAQEQGVRAIVIGSRGLRGLRSKLLGSTSAHVLEHAACPVVVVRAPPDGVSDEAKP
jgi:nucleotide-binding universal stress UspA family protein